MFAPVFSGPQDAGLHLFGPQKKGPSPSDKIERFNLMGEMIGEFNCTTRTGSTVASAAVSALADFKNPFDTDAAAVTSTGAATGSTDKGYVRVIASSNTLTITTCFDNSTDTSGSDCSVAADRVENTVDVN